MTKFNAKHKQDLQFILNKFNKYVIGEKCNAMEIAETVAKIVEMSGLETCDCKQKIPPQQGVVSGDDIISAEQVRAQKAAKLNRMREASQKKAVEVENTKDNGQKPGNA